MGRQRILVIDASPAVRETAAAVLADTFDVVTVRDAAELTPITAADPFVLVIAGVASLPPTLAAQEVPVLWLAPDGDPKVRPARHGGSILPRDFLPPELRGAVRRILAGNRRPSELTVATRLTHPFLAAATVPIAEQAARTALPVLISGPRYTSRGALAQALHRESSRGPLVLVSARSLSAGTRMPDTGTIFIDRIERLLPEQQDCVLGALQADGTWSCRIGQRLRVIAGTECGVDAMLQEPEIPPELIYRLNVLPLPLVPLRERPQDIAPLAQIIGNALARVLELAAVSFTPRALERLSTHLWFGDIVELEAVLARSLALSRKEMIDVDDLRFALTDAPTPTLDRSSVTASVPDNATLHSHALDLVINEVAHEIKNPLVTIKTFAQHLRRQGSEGSEEQQLARLTGDAVDEIDHTVENLVQFTRLEEPQREPIALQAVLAPAVALLTQLVRPRTRRVDYRPPPPVSITVDRGQVTYGLNNLFRVLARGLGDTGRIVVGYEDPGCIVIEFPTGFAPSEAQLGALVGEAPPGSAPSSLAAAIAQRVLERNGGVLTFETQRQPPRVTVKFLLSDVEEVSLARTTQAPRVGR